LGDSSPSWNASAKVKTIINSTTLEIEAAFYSDEDINYFQVGDVIEYSMPGSDDTILTKTISAISGNQITFSSNHGASVGGIIQPTTFSSAPAHHTKRAYIDRSFIYE